MDAAEAGHVLPPKPAWPPCQQPGAEHEELGVALNGPDGASSFVDVSVNARANSIGTVGPF